MLKSNTPEELLNLQVKEFNKGVEADHKGEQDDAIRHYERALASAPDYYPAHNNLRCDYLNKADFKFAQVQCEKAIRLNQNDGQAFLTDAIGELRSYLKAFPDQPFAARGREILQKARLKRADQCLLSHFLGTSEQNLASSAQAATYSDLATVLFPIL